jgi:uncharacterized protein YoxC
MAIFQESFESGSSPWGFDALTDWGGGSLSLDTSSKISGSNSIKITRTAGGGVFLQKAFASDSEELYFQLKLFLPTGFSYGTAGYIGAFYIVGSSDQGIFNINIEEAGALTINGASIGWRGTGITLAENTVNTIEGYAKFNGTTGNVKLWVNNSTEGSPDYNSGNINSGTVQARKIRTAEVWSDSAHSDFFFDDVIVNSSFIGTGTPEPLKTHIIDGIVKDTRVSNVSASSNKSTTTSVVINKPANVQDGDILIAFVTGFRSTSATAGDITAPTGWNLINRQAISTRYKVGIFWKRASSEGATYTFTSASSTQMQGVISAYRGCKSTGNPYEVLSNTLYETSGTIVRAASMITTRGGGAIIWAGWYYVSGVISLAEPSGFTSRGVELNTNNAVRFADLLNASAQITGNKDGTAGATCTVKHAYMLELLPEDAIKTHTIDGIVSEPPAADTYTTTHSLDGIVKAFTLKTHTLNGAVKETKEKTHSVDGITKEINTKTHTLDAVVKAVNLKTHEIEGVIKETKTVTYTVDGIVKVIVVETHTIDGIISEPLPVAYTAQHSLDAIIKETKTKDHTIDGIVKAVAEKTFSLDSIVKVIQEKTHTIDGLIKAENLKTYTIDGIVKEINIITHEIDGIVKETKTATYTIDGIIREVDAEIYTATHTIDGIIKATQTTTHTIDGIVKEINIITHTADGIIKEIKTAAYNIDGIVKEIRTATHTIDGIVKATATITHTLDGIVKAEAIIQHDIDGTIKEINIITHSVEGIIAERETKEITIDGVVKTTGTQTHQIDGIVLSTYTAEITVDCVIIDLRTIYQSQNIPLNLPNRDFTLNLNNRDFTLNLPNRDFILKLKN